MMGKLSEAVVYKALDRQREYHFVERNGQWYAKYPRNLQVSFFVDDRGAGCGGYV